MTIPPPPPEEDPQDRSLTEVEVDIEAPVDVTDPVVQDFEVDIEELTSEEEEVSEVVEMRGRDDAVAAVEMGESGAFMTLGAGSNAAGMTGDRRGAGRGRALRQYGSSRQAEAAVDAALRWFARHQSPNGMWDVTGYPENCTMSDVKCEPGTRYTGADGDAAATAYAVLTFLGGGHDHRYPNQFRRTVQNGIDWLVQNQLASGGWGRDRNYENGICAMALAEAYAMTNDPDLREPTQRAIDHLLARQIDAGGAYGGLGWDYTTSDARNDSSVSGWVVMALKSAEAGGIDVGSGMEGARNYLNQAWKASNTVADITDPYTHRSGFPYTWDALSGDIRRPDRTAIGLCMGVFLGKGQGNIIMETMANDVMARALDDREADYQIDTWPVNTYYLYYNTLGIFQVGGDRWQRWNAHMRDLLVDSQRRSDDCFDGSWDYDGTRFHGHQVGRLVSTAYAALSLQVYYRYRPQDAHLTQRVIKAQ
ncbi:MAG: hypothetical protein EA401_12295 [Planctomycetota bacterium]|nr:MAG: hypothetical protein EA401_12295 [Planctomycetota bacterium]